MAADVVSSTAPSKAAQKKKAKKEASATAVTTTEPTPPVTGGSADTGGEEPKVHGEGPIKDLQRCDTFIPPLLHSPFGQGMLTKIY